MNAISFDWSISIGHVFTAIIFIGGWIIAFTKLQGEVRIVKHDMKNIIYRQELMTETIRVVGEILTKVAVQDERFNSLEHRVESNEDDIRDMQHGKGFVSEELRGEYTRHGKVK